MRLPETNERDQDPILRVVKPGAEPPDLEDGEERSDLDAGGGPTAGRTTVDEAKRKGFFGFLQLVGPGLDFVMALVAVLGTTISPYLFSWQASAEVDELRAARLDVLILTSAAVLHAHGKTDVQTADQAAAALAPLAGPFAFIVSSGYAEAWPASRSTDPRFT